MQTREMKVHVANGLSMVGFAILVGLALAGWFYMCITAESIAGCVVGGVAVLIWFVGLLGFFTLQPNEAAVLMLFGKYVGTADLSGLRWANPFYTKVKISMRARNINASPIKVNDKMGNPIEIATIIVWHVEDTARAVFDVDKYEQYVMIQTEAALRHLAMAYPYDTFEGHTESLRGNPDEISTYLKQEVQDRVSVAGVRIDDARLSHLAYAPEIAGAMLQRQQAEAIVAARSRIVDGAVGMVEMALARLAQEKVIEFDDERKAAMVSNLMVVLCGHEQVRPVINTGTLYT